MTSPRYWTDPLSGVDYAHGQQLKATHMNAYRDACLKLDAVLERTLSQSWFVDGHDPAYPMKTVAYEPLGKKWVLMGDSSGTPGGYYGSSPRTMYASSVVAGDGLTPTGSASTTRTSTLTKTVMVCGTPGSSSDKKYRVSTDSGQSFDVATSSATSSSGLTTICFHVDRFVAGGAAGFVEYSTNGTSFVAATPANSNALRALRSNGTLIVGITGASTNKIVKSVDGVTWTESTLPATIAARAIAWIPKLSKWAIYALSGMYTSSDAVTWTASAIVTGGGLTIDDMVSTGNQLVGITDYAIVASDDMGSNWREVYEGSAPTEAIAAGTDADEVVGQMMLATQNDPVIYSINML